MSTPSSTTTSCSSFSTDTPPPPPPHILSCFAAKLFGSLRYHHHLFDQIHNIIEPSFSAGSPWGSRWGGVEDCGADLNSFMAAQGGNFPHNIPLDIRRKKLSWQQKRDSLEREVSMLQKMLNQEEKLHEILEDVHQHLDVSGFSIPNFLPPKIKELLTELAMVESEIARLESQISQLQLGLKHEQEFTKETKSRQWQPAMLNNHQGRPPPYASHPSPLSKGAGNEKVAFETKALHFINKAIKGDYKLNDFNANEKLRGSRLVADQKEHEELKLQEKIPRRSSMVKSPSPLRDPRHPSPKLRERIPDSSLDLPPKSLSSVIISEENSQNWHPNKLSENIMKCLNFIYVRLLRTSRAMELDKSGPGSRSTQSSLNSRSFRADTGLNTKSNLMSHKESRQQDPYGIFDIDDSIPRDIGPYKNLVIFTSSSMDSKCISSSSSVPLIKKLRVLMNNLHSVDLSFLTYQQKLAFWINMYNACIMHGFLQFGVPNSPENMVALMNKATLNIGGNTISAHAIEHYILRKPTSPNMKEAYQKGDKEDKETLVWKLYGLESMDPNVTFGLCYGTRSSPAVRVYTGDGVIGELEKSKQEYLQASIVVTNTKRILFPELLLQHLLDFAFDIETLVEWVCHQLPTSGSLRKSMVDCFRTPQNNNAKISITVDKIPYDFEFQYLLAI